MATQATQATGNSGTPGTTTVAVPPRRRAGLTQERSRDTRRRLVRTAMRLWTERGFETGIEDTTVDEIVQAAGGVASTLATSVFVTAASESAMLAPALRQRAASSDSNEAVW